MYTIEQLKSELPPVKVNLGEPWGIKECPVAGRKKQFPSVLLPLGYVHIAWKTYLNCINNNRPVQL